MRIIDVTGPASGLSFAVVVAKYNDFVTDRLQKGAIEALAHHGVRADDITVIRVPGAFEIPTAARLAAQTHRYDGIICLGCLIRGATPHFEYISSAVAHGLTQASGDTGVPMAFGVLTVNSAEEALERAVDGPGNKGWEAATATVEMALIAGELAAEGADA